MNRTLICGYVLVLLSVLVLVECQPVALTLSGMTVNAPATATTSIQEFTLVPAFEPLNSDYTINIPNAVTAVSIVATLVDPESRMKLTVGTATAIDFTGTNLQQINVGMNPMMITVIGNDGAQNTYHFTIVRAEPPSKNLQLLKFIDNAANTINVLPPFDPAVTLYTIMVPLTAFDPAQKQFVINAQVQTQDATAQVGVSIDGAPALNMPATTLLNIPMPLAPAKTHTLSLGVIASDLQTQQYLVHITCVAAPANATANTSTVTDPKTGTTKTTQLVTDPVTGAQNKIVTITTVDPTTGAINSQTRTVPVNPNANPVSTILGKLKPLPTATTTGVHVNDVEAQDFNIADANGASMNINSEPSHYATLDDYKWILVGVFTGSVGLGIVSALALRFCLNAREEKLKQLNKNRLQVN